MGPAASQPSLAPQAALGPQAQVPLLQRSPAPQHRPLHAGPAGQPSVGAQAAAGAPSPTPASPGSQPMSVQATSPSVQLHELQPSPAGKMSPDR